MRRPLVLVTLWILGIGTLAGQASNIPASQITAFIGEWTFVMTNPPSSEQTVKIWDENGVAAATLQVGKFPATKVTGIFQDGNVLVLTTTARENGVPIWVVIALTREGDTMRLAQMMQQSQTIKRGDAQKRN
jgi:hypothetical protein